MHLQVLPQNSPLLWQLIDHKHIVSIPELLRCYTIIMVNFKQMHTQIFRLWRKSHSLLDDPRTIIKELSGNSVSSEPLYVFIIVIRERIHLRIYLL